LFAQNKVLQLDGIDDYVELPTQPFENLDNATIEMWVKWHYTSYFSQPFGYGREWKALVINNEQQGNNLRFFLPTTIKNYISFLSIELLPPMNGCTFMSKQ